MMVHVLTATVQTADHPHAEKHYVVGVFIDPTEPELIQAMGEAGQAFAGKRVAYRRMVLEPNHIAPAAL